MRFRPYVHRVQAPMVTAATGPSTDTNANRSIVRSVVFPVGQVVDLLTIPPSLQRDFFLWHPYLDQVQDVMIGSVEDADAPAGFQAWLVQQNRGSFTELTSPQSFTRFTIEPVSLELPGQVLDGPVFLRVSSPPADQQIFVTVHILTSELP